MLHKTGAMLAFVASALLGSVAMGEDNVDFWLKQAKPSSQPTAPQESADDSASKAATPAAPVASAPAGPSRADALPGAIELSDGKILAGFMYTTNQKDWEVYIEQEKMYHRVPFIAVLSITANVVEEKQELEWRWKEMGTPERIYTGRSYPTRRLTWTLKLIDGTSVTGAIQGQPLWIEQAGTKIGPMILPERTKGEMGKKNSELIYVKRIIVSKLVLEQLQPASK